MSDPMVENALQSLMEDQMVFAVPGEGNIIDTVVPGPCELSRINGETLEEIQVRYPGAVMVSMASWLEEKAKAQNTPVQWFPVTEEAYMYGLEVLPPVGWEGDAFMTGEPTDHCAKTGQPRYQAYKSYEGKRFTSSRPMTLREFQETVTRKK